MGFIPVVASVPTCATFLFIKMCLDGDEGALLLLHNIGLPPRAEGGRWNQKFWCSSANGVGVYFRMWIVELPFDLAIGVISMEEPP